MFLAIRATHEANLPPAAIQQCETRDTESPYCNTGGKIVNKIAFEQL